MVIKPKGIDWVYDIETYPNVFTVTFASVDGKSCWSFEISDRKDDSDHIRKICGQMYRNKDRMVGFNNLAFDYPVMHYFLKHRGLTAKDLYDKAMSVITASDDDKFKHLIQPHKMLIPQLDLYKIHHFDNAARSTSLKMLEFNMRSENIEDLPFPVGKVLTNEEIDILLTYNQHDVYQTYLFYKESLGAISFRETLSEKYNKDFMNHNDTKIGKDYFIMRLEEEMAGCCYKKVDGKRKIQQTWRKEIDLNEIIFPYIKFERPEFNAVLDWIRKQKIKETKGVFNDLKEHELGSELAKYAKMRKKQKKLTGEPSEEEIQEMKLENPSVFIEERELKSGKTVWYKCWNVAEGLNCIVDGFQFDFGTGGLHGSIEGTTVKSDDEYIIVDEDVASMYPNVSIANTVYPAHLGVNFCEIYQDVYNERKSYPKGSPENAMMKLALNGVYGDSNNKFSPFYDPQYTMSITVNGQLSLCMFVEMLLSVEGVSIIQANTDGVTYRVPRKNKHLTTEMSKRWEVITGLEMEAVDYSQMIIRDVNNYIAVTTDGKVKRKGAYEFEGLGWHQNHSALVIKMAAFHELVEGGDAESFIRNHEDHMDFMLRTKVPRSSRLMWVRENEYDVQLQNICRYYISNSGGSLVKVMPPIEGKVINATKFTDESSGDEYFAKTKVEFNRFTKAGYRNDGEVELPPQERPIGIDSKWLVTPCNDIKSFIGDINYNYYIDEARMLIDCVVDK